MRDSTVTSPGLNSKTEWVIGLIVGGAAIIMLLAWFMWGRTFQLALAMLAAGSAIIMLRYLAISAVIAGFIVVAGFGYYLPGSTSAFFGGVLLILIIRKLIARDLGWRLGTFMIAAGTYIIYYQSTAIWVDQSNYLHWHLILRVLPAIVVISELIDTPKKYILFFIGCAIGMTFTSVSAIRTAAEFYASGVADQLAGTVQSIESSRFFGHWPDPNIMSMTLTAFLGGVIGLWRSQISAPIRLLMLVATITTIAAVLLSLSRAGLISCTIVVLLMLAVERKRFVLFAVVSAVVAILLLVLPIDIFGRVQSMLAGTDASSGERLALATSGWRIFWSNPIFGAGMGGFENEVLFILPYLTHGVFAHNTLVDLAVDGGIVAVILFVIAFIAASKGLNWREWKIDPADPTAKINAGLRAGLTGSIVSILTMSSAAYVPFWVLFTLCAMYAASIKHDNDNRTLEAA